MSDWSKLPEHIGAGQVWEVEMHIKSAGVVFETLRYLLLIALPPEGPEWTRTHLVRSHCRLGDVQKEKPSVILRRLWRLHNMQMHPAHWSFNLLTHNHRRLYYKRQRGYWQ